MNELTNGNNNNITTNTKLSIIDSITLDSVQKTLNKINAFHAIIKSTLILDVDYGIIPGTTKPVLFKSGAETILMLFGLASSIEILSAVPEQLNKESSFVAYTVKCQLLKHEDIFSEGVGTCNSREKKYLNEDPLNIANTILKMASKRALLDAVLRVASLSSVFSIEATDMNDYLTKEALDNLGVDDASNLKITFGKHKGKTCGDVYKNDLQYVKWFFENGRDDKIKKAFDVLAEAVRFHSEKATKKDTNDDTNAERGINNESNADINNNNGNGND
jgi:hypothetical protein